MKTRTWVSVIAACSFAALASWSICLTPVIAAETSPRKRVAAPPEFPQPTIDELRKQVSPVVQRYLRIKARADSRVEYADFISEAALDEARTIQLLDALTDRDEIYAYESNSLDMDVEAMGRRLDEADGLFFTRIRAALGDAAAKRLRAFEDCAHARKTIYQLASELAVGPDPRKPSPLSEEQRRQWLKYVIDDAERHPPAERLPAPGDKAGQAALLQSEKGREVRFDAMAKSLLSVEQYRHFRESRQAQREIEESRGW